jgi:hypothetical protein
VGVNVSDDFGFAAPPFNPESALQTLKRFVRDQRQLVERGAGYELAGSPVLQLSVGEGVITAKLARRATRTPEWDTVTVKNHAELRKLQDELKRRIARWTEGRDE